MFQISCMSITYIHMLVCKLQLVIFFFIYDFVYLLVAVLGLHCCSGFSLVAASVGCSLLWCAGFSLRRLLLLWSAGCGLQYWGMWASVVPAPGL